MTQLYGTRMDLARRFTYLSLGSFSANATASPTARFGVPPGHAGIRIRSISVLGSAIPVDSDGTMLLNVLINDISEGGDDTIVASEDLETLLVAANRFYAATLATETAAEKQLTMRAGDSLRCTLVNNSAGIGTNTNVVVMIEWHEVPDYENLETVNHPDRYYNEL